jgi:hypothetical protein
MMKATAAPAGISHCTEVHVYSNPDYPIRVFLSCLSKIADGVAHLPLLNGSNDMYARVRDRVPGRQRFCETDPEVILP